MFSVQDVPIGEQTPAALPQKLHQSPGRQHQPTDPRRESTVLFKGFSASTAESGLLEVDEIAEINGSPELVRPPHDGKSPTDPQAPAHASVPVDRQSASLTQHVSLAETSAHPAGLLLHHSLQNSQMQQQHPEDTNSMHAGAIGMAASGTPVDRAEQQELHDSDEVSCAPALRAEHSSPRLQAPQELADDAQVAAAAATALARHAMSSKPLSDQVRIFASNSDNMYSVCICNDEMSVVCPVSHQVHALHASVGHSCDLLLATNDGQ